MKKICQRELSLCGPLRVARQPRPAAFVDPFSVATIRGVKGVIFFTIIFIIIVVANVVECWRSLAVFVIAIIVEFGFPAVIFVTAAIVITIAINIIVIMVTVYCH